MSHKHRQHARSGFTAFELMVVIVVIIILILLLLPAINAAREAARRNGCINQMRQLALAAINHESATLRFPLANSAPAFPEDKSNLGRVVPGTRTTEKYEVDTKYHHNNDGYSWLVRILPYLEEAVLYDELANKSEQFTRTAFDTTVASDPDDITTHFSTVPLDVVRCPSFAGAETARDRKNYGLPPQAQLPGSNYAAMAAATRGVIAPKIVDDHNSKLGGIIISRASNNFRGLKIREIRDGTSKTLLLAETISEVYSSWYSGQSAWVTGFSPDQPPKMVKAEDGVRVSSNPSRRNRTALNLGEPGQPYAKTLEGSTRVFGPGSYHAGGVVIHAFADGHCQAIPDSIDPTVYFRAITRAGNEPNDI